MSSLYLGNPNEKQKLFLKAKVKHVGYGGARGGGKSWAVRSKAILLSGKFKGIRICIVRKTYPELEQNHVIPLKGLLRGIAKYNKQEKTFTFPNGSTIKLQYCRNDSDLENFQGVEFDVIFIDEATNLSEHQLKVIAACCRGVNNFPHRIYYTCNPGGQGHAYIKRIFIDRIYEDGEDPDEYQFIQALVQDNDALMEADPDYIKFLQGLPPKLRQAWLEGSWDVYSGQFFEQFRNIPDHYEDRQWTHVIEPFDIPIGWKIYRSYDFGYSRPFSCGWYAVDYDGIIYRILELYGWTGVPNEGVKWSPDKQMAEIKKVEEQHPYLKGRQITGIADPAIWQKDTGESVNDVALKHHLFFQKGDHERIAGWMQCQFRLQFDDNGYPMFYCFSNCKQFIRTIPLMMYSEVHVEDLDTDLEDHISDEWRYMMMSRPISPRKANKEIKLEDDPLNQRVPKKKSIYVKRG